MARFERAALVKKFHAMVKRGAYYLVLTGGLGVSYAIAVFVLDWALRGTGFADSPAFAVLFTVAVLVLFNPLRTRLQSLIDRTFFRSTYDAAKVLAEIGGRLSAATHHHEVARPDPSDTRAYLEQLTKAVFRAGLNWKVVENKWPGFMEVFHDFDPEYVAHLSPKQVEAIEANPAVIRNRSKIEATVENASVIGR